MHACMHECTQRHASRFPLDAQGLAEQPARSSATHVPYVVLRSFGESKMPQGLTDGFFSFHPFLVAKYVLVYTYCLYRLAGTR